MLKIIMLGLVLAAIALSGAVSVAISVTSAETVPSPLQQVRDCVPIGEVVCSEDRVLMMSQLGMPACVFEESVLLLKTRGFEFIGEPFDMFPIKSSDSQQNSAGIGQINRPAVVSMSMLPSINETAVVEITYTNQFENNVTDSEDASYRDFHSLGWVVSSGFEIVDSCGVEPWTMYNSRDEPSVLTYIEFVQLDVGESKTYRIEVRAVNDGHSYVTGLGYGFSTARINLYLDDEETLTYNEHWARYPEMHPVPKSTPYVRSIELFPPLTDEQRDAAQDEPTREETVEWFTNYLIDSGNSADWAVVSLWHSGILNATEIRTVLAGANFTDDEIDRAMTDNVADIP